MAQRVDKPSVTHDSAVSDLVDRLADGFVEMIRLIRITSIIKRLAIDEPADLTASESREALVQMGSEFVAQPIRTAQREAVATHLDADQTGETLLTVALGLMLAPGCAISLGTEVIAKQYASQHSATDVFWPGIGARLRSRSARPHAGTAGTWCTRSTKPRVRGIHCLSTSQWCGR